MKNSTIKIFNFMKFKNTFTLLSLFLIISSFVLLGTRGLNMGVDFNGGTLIQLQYKDKPVIENVRKIIVKDETFGSSTISKFGNNNEITIKTIVSSNNVANDLNSYIKDILKETGDFEIRRIDMVGPKVGEELTKNGLLSMFLALLSIFIYVYFRFEWKFSLSSIIPLFHDIIITMGLLSLFKIEVNLDVLAALLTIIGYSLNDTIIIFDRIRENVVKVKDNLDNIINYSISSTLSRTLITSLTTLLVVISLTLFGGDIIKPFSITLLMGIIIGTYSSIYVASSGLTYLKFDIKNYTMVMNEKEKQRKEKDKLRNQFENGIV
jgi:preprotein translocase subunit SecF